MSDLLADILNEPPATDFAAFWQQFPRKVKRIAAEIAYWQVRRGWKKHPPVSHETIMAGLAVYDFGTIPRWQPHAASWLHAGGWIIEDDTPPPQKPLVAPIDMLAMIDRSDAPDWLKERMKQLSGTDTIERLQRRVEP